MPGKEWTWEKYFWTWVNISPKGVGKIFEINFNMYGIWWTWNTEVRIKEQLLLWMTDILHWSVKYYKVLLFVYLNSFKPIFADIFSWNIWHLRKRQVIKYVEVQNNYVYVVLIVKSCWMNVVVEGHRVLLKTEWL